jgi:hypothetical protein
MGIGRDMYTQHSIKEHLSSNECMKTRRSAMRAAKMAMEANCDVDFPTQELVDMIEANWRRGNRLRLYCYCTRSLPWSLVRWFAPRL